MSTVATELGLSECRARYVGLYQETADFFNQLLDEGGSLAERVEEAARFGGLAVHSTLERKVYSQESITNSRGSRVWADPFRGSGHFLGKDVSPGVAIEDRRVHVLLPDSGDFNRQYISKPRLSIIEFRSGDIFTLLQVSFGAGDGTKVHGFFGEGFSSSCWHDSRAMPDGGMRLEPNLANARWVGQELITEPNRIESYFRPAEALVNALRGIAGEFIER